MDGIFLLNKSPGITSFQVLGQIKKNLGTRKVGHTGTLDKFAEGLMLVVSGKFTRLAPFFSGMDKVYEARIKFGVQTETLDPEGDVIEEGTVPSLEIVKKQINRFTGKIKQIPPRFSAVHIDGKRAYQRVLGGEEIQVPEREIEIYSFDISDFSDSELTAVIHCSKGTYIRSLARDLGKACGSCAYLAGLKRIKVGPFSLEESSFGDEINEKKAIPPEIVFNRLPDIEIATVNNGVLDKIRNGIPFRKSFFIDKIPVSKNIAVFSEEKKMICMLKKENNCFLYHFVINDRS